MNKLLAIAVVAAVLPLSAFAVELDTSVGSSMYGDTKSGSSAAGASMDVKVETTAAKVETKAEAETGDKSVDVKVESDGDDMDDEINGDPDFDLFAKTVTSSHAEVSAVEVDEDGGVEVAYDHQGWLFGFIPVTVTSHTTVDETGSADVSLPWWSFLVSGVSDIQTNAQAELNADAGVKAEASAQTSTSARIKLVEAIVSSLVKADAAMKASWNLKENVK